MKNPISAAHDRVLLARNIETAIKIGVLGVLLLYCYQIVRPFIVPLVWGLIIAVAIYPAFTRLRAFVGGRNSLAAALVTVILLAALLIPAVMLSDTLIQGATNVVNALTEGRLSIPPSPEGMADWPLIGKPLSTFWSLATTNIEAAAAQIGPQLKDSAVWLLGAAAGAGLALVQFVAAVVISGVLLAHAAAGERISASIASRLADERGLEFERLMITTVRSVTRGIIGVALLQSILAGLGFLAVGVPGAGLWALLCLILAIVQIGVFPIVAPAAFYVVATSESTLVTVLFLGWSIAVGLLDNILKPLLLGRGVDVPMVVIFIGAIGGFLASGLVGLFIGSVILVLGYRLFLVWLDEAASPAADDATRAATSNDQADGEDAARRF
jgi:predicted PurR-regulated permease PerM